MWWPYLFCVSPESTRDYPDRRGPSCPARPGVFDQDSRQEHKRKLFSHVFTESWISWASDNLSSYMLLWDVTAEKQGSSTKKHNWSNHYVKVENINRSTHKIVASISAHSRQPCPHNLLSNNYNLLGFQFVGFLNGARSTDGSRVWQGIIETEQMMNKVKVCLYWAFL